mgnify:CR=1 FL=1
MSQTALLEELASNLVKSNAALRKQWAIDIIQNNYAIVDFCTLLESDKKIAMRFTWLLSDIGILNPAYLRNSLATLFTISQSSQYTPFVHAFATYWQIVGVPAENETEAINLLFDMLQNKEINATLKSRAIFVCEGIVIKHPGLKNEFFAILNRIKSSASEDFKKRVKKVINRLELIK